MASAITVLGLRTYVVPSYPILLKVAMIVAIRKGIMIEKIRKTSTVTLACLNATR